MKIHSLHRGSIAPLGSVLIALIKNTTVAAVILGTAESAGLLAEITDPLRRAGQLTLSLYLAHVLVFNLTVDWLGWIEPAGTSSALLFAAGFWVGAIAVATWWQRRFGRGPAEYVYRAFGG